MPCFAIETAAGTDRQYFAGDPRYPDSFMLKDGPRSGVVGRVQTPDSGPCDDLVKWKDLGQAQQTLQLFTRRTYATLQACEEAAATIMDLHRWAGTAVQLIQVHGYPGQFKVYKAADAVLLLTWRPVGVSLEIDYTLRFGKWVLEAGDPEVIAPRRLTDEGVPRLVDDGETARDTDIET